MSARPPTAIEYQIQQRWADWHRHKEDCPKCYAADFTRTSTWGATCLNGAHALKAIAETLARKHSRKTTT